MHFIRFLLSTDFMPLNMLSHPAGNAIPACMYISHFGEAKHKTRWTSVSVTGFALILSWKKPSEDTGSGRGSPCKTITIIQLNVFTQKQKHLTYFNLY